MLGLTVRNTAEPFRGRGPNPTLIAGTPVTLGRMETRIIESDLAEVI